MLRWLAAESNWCISTATQFRCSMNRPSGYTSDRHFDSHAWRRVIEPPDCFSATAQITIGITLACDFSWDRKARHTERNCLPSPDRNITVTSLHAWWQNGVKGKFPFLTSWSGHNFTPAHRAIYLSRICIWIRLVALLIRWLKKEKKILLYAGATEPTHIFFMGHFFFLPVLPKSCKISHFLTKILKFWLKFVEILTSFCKIFVLVGSFLPPEKKKKTWPTDPTLESPSARKQISFLFHFFFIA